MEKLTESEQDFITGYANALQDLMASVTGSNSCGKSYDPIEIEGNIIYSYAFDLKNGSRQHPISEFKDITEIKQLMLKEATDWIKNINYE